MKDMKTILAKFNESELNRIKNLGRSSLLENRSDEEVIKPLARLVQGEHLSASQKRMWLIHEIEGGSVNYHVPVTYKLTGNLNTELFCQALNTVFRRHQVLRSTFIVQNLTPVAKVLSEETPFPLVFSDLRPVDDKEKILAQLVEETFNSPFDFVQGPLLRACLVQLQNNEYIFLLSQHHIITDGWSIGIFINELCTIYNDLIHHRAISLHPLSLDYFDYTTWQNRYLTEEKLASQIAYWKPQLADIPPLLTLPITYPRPKKPSQQGNTCTFTIDQQLTEQLKLLSQKNGMTLFMTVMAAWAIVLNRLSGQDSVVIGTPFANRNRTEIREMVGFFVNMLPVRIDIDSELSIEGLLNQVKNTVINVQDNQDIPFERIVEVINPERSLSYSPIFQVLLAWQDFYEEELAFEGIEVVPVNYVANKVKFDLELFMHQRGGEIVGGINYATELFDKQTIERHLSYYLIVLRAMVGNVAQRVRNIDILPESERSLQLNQWNKISVDGQVDYCLHQLVEQQVANTPDAVALIFQDKTLSYDELNRQANQLAHCLIAEGVKPDNRVAICVDRSLQMIIGLLAILKAGAGYVSLDPVYPKERLQYILQDAAPILVLQDNAGAEALQGVLSDKQKSIYFSQVQDKDLSEENPKVSALKPHHLAYVIYTSGSTGQPKGVMVEHRQVTRLLTTTERLFSFKPDDVWCLAHSFSFDFSVWEIFGALYFAGRLVIIPSDKIRSIDDFYHIVTKEKVTVLNQTPSAFNSFIEVYQSAQSCLRYIIFGGEALMKTTLEKFRTKERNHNIKLINMYGITEITVHATFREVNEEDIDNRVLIGHPLSDLSIYIVDEQLHLLPAGAVGEMYVGGAGVTRGYLNRSELTAQRFMTDPFNPASDSRMYRTGDLARYDHEGNIEYIGRNDHQVKIRGFRIELGEIEACLETHPRVREAVVLAREGNGGDKRLVAYVVLSSLPVNGQMSATLRQHLLSSLPEYMVPAAFVVLAHFPLTTNGKLDRRALPEPDESAYQRQVYEAPRGEIEQLLAQCWCELLGVEKVGRNDNFFTLGGHSLLVVQLMGLLRKRRHTIQAGALFSTPVFHEQAALLKEADDVSVIPLNQITLDTDSITPEMLPLAEMTQADIDTLVSQVPGGIQNIQDIYGLSPLQDGIFFHHLLAKDGDPYQVMSQLAFKNRACLDAYINALQQVIHRHDILRTAFFSEQLTCGPVQVVLRNARLQIKEMSLSTVSSDSFISQLVTSHTITGHRMALDEAPLLHLLIAKEWESERWLALQVMHHLIGDHTTLEVMHREIEHILSGQTSLLPPAVPYRNLIAYANQVNRDKAYEPYFQRMLADIDEPTAPFGLYDVMQDGSRVDECHIQLPAELNIALRELARRYGVTLASLAHLGWGMVLAKSTGRQQVVTGTVLFGRLGGETGIEQGVGLFINTLPLRLDIDERSVVNVLEETHQRLSDLLSYEQTPLVAAQRCSGVIAPAPLFTALFNYRHNEQDISEYRKSYEQYGIEMLDGEEQSNYPVSISVEDCGTQLGLTAQVVSPLSASRLCGYLQQALIQLTWALNEQPDLPICQLDVLPTAERTLLLDTWNSARIDDKTAQCICIHHQFEFQTVVTPDAIALEFNGLKISYAELNSQANKLAHRLLAEGVKPDSRVVICVAKSPAMVMSMLAVLKAGGAYVPIDPDYPQARLAYILQDAAPVLVLHDQAGEKALSALNSEFTLLDLNQPLDVSLSKDNPDIPNLTTENLAYIIYTSGSTGQPKGVMVDHQAIYQRWLGFNELYKVTPQDRVLQFSSFSFDASVEEFFSSLCNGATLVIRDNCWLSSIQEFISQVKKNRITVISLPTLFWAELAARDKALPLSEDLRLIIIGGEAVKKSSTQAWFSHKTHRPCLLNTYGPTENTVIATCQEIVSADNVCSIGKPVMNTAIYLLDKYGQPAPLGSIGEIYIGGVGVACGYLNLPELSAERFVSDPFARWAGARMYRTGDMARYDNQGNIEYLGRNDHQVKIRGYRIELREIEERLESHPIVNKSVVLARDTARGSKQLVAYLTVFEKGEDNHIIEQLREYLSSDLPDYMIPADFLILDNMPMNTSGKIDYKSLPLSKIPQHSTDDFSPPANMVQKVIAEIWMKVLGVSRIDQNDNFFNIGGDSILSIKMNGIVKSVFNIDVEYSRIFINSTLKQFSSFVSTRIGMDA
ncbi:amino acid adenylation domain-containing protein [Photorhabdus sp. RM323S]|uniref:amino acid adenylation domain-containing protein n=1 Tax=Photorhabdus sp. RM323S TaxID=3342828 RepID=UPI0036DC6F1E